MIDPQPQKIQFTTEIQGIEVEVSIDCQGVGQTGRSQFQRQGSRGLRCHSGTAHQAKIGIGMISTDQQIAFAALQEAHGWLDAGQPDLAEQAIADAEQHLQRAEQQREVFTHERG